MVNYSKRNKISATKEREDDIDNKIMFFEKSVDYSFFYIFPALIFFVFLGVILLNGVAWIPAIVYAVIVTAFSHFFGKLLLGKL